MKSKLVKKPKLSKLPCIQGYVKHSIISKWIANGSIDLLQTFCKPGIDTPYEFKLASDFNQTICQVHTILGKQCTLIFNRHVHLAVPFQMLNFTDWKLDIEVIYAGKRHKYINDKLLTEFLSQ
jgi:hypothetical protein